MRPFPQPGAATLLVVILSTCLLLLLFQKMIWLVLPVLLALLLYYSLRPVVDALVVYGVRRETAAKAVCLLQMIVAASVLVLALLFLAKAGTWQSNFGRYLAGGQNLLRKTTGALEGVMPMFKRMNLGAQVDDQHVRQFTDGFVEKHLLPITLQLLESLPSLLLVPYITYFMLTDSARLKKYIIKSVPNAFFEKGAAFVFPFGRQSPKLLSRLACAHVSGRRLSGARTRHAGNCPRLLVGIGGRRCWPGFPISDQSSVHHGCIVAATDFPDQPGRLTLAWLCSWRFAILDDFVFLPLTIGRKLRVHPLLSVLMLFLGVTVAGATGLSLCAAFVRGGRGHW